MHIPQDDNLLIGSSRDGVLPLSLVTAIPASTLSASETPDAYGMDITADGKIGKGTIPTGTARIAKTVTLDLTTKGAGDAVPFLLYYGRLWNITGLTNAGTSTVLKIGSPNYESDWLLQSTDFSFNEDSNPILGIIPLNRGGMAVLKATGIYIVDNVYDPRGTQFFRRSDIIQEMAVDSLAHVTELDGVLYVCNTNGLIAYQDGQTVDLTRNVRDDKTNFKSLALKSDYVNKRIIATDDGSTGFVYDVPSRKIMRYSGSSFRVTSQQWRHPQWYLANVDTVKFAIEHGNTNDGLLKFQYRFEEFPWSDELSVPLDYSNQEYEVVEWGLPERANAYTFQIRLTDLSAGKYVKEVRVIGEAWNE